MALKEKNKMAQIDFKPKLRGELDFKPREFKFSERQQTILDCLLDEKTKIVFLSGPAGTSKTFLSVYAALHILNGDFDKEIVYIRSLVESASRSLGYLPGMAEEKFQPFMLPLMEKLEEIVSETCTKQLLAAEKVKAIPINFLRGASFKDKIILVDEFQNTTRAEAATIISRIGENTKYFITGDPMQSDINGKSAMKDYFHAFNNDESRANGIFCFEFTNEDIVRSEILKFIISKIEGINASAIK